MTKWNKEDFNIVMNKIKGFSPSGLEKLEKENGAVTFPKFEGVDAIDTKENSHDILSAYIEDGYKEIRNEAFKESLLKTIRVPDSLETIGSEAFRYTDIEEFNFGENLEFIGKAAFSSTDLKNVDLSKTKIKAISPSVFSFSSLIETVKLPQGITTIGNEAFRALSHLKEVTIPKSVETIGEGAFRGSGIERVILEDGSKLNTIGSSAFETETLQEINLEKAGFLEYIGFWAFYGVNLSSLKIETNAESLVLGTNSFKESFIVDASIICNGENLTIYSGAFENTALQSAYFKAKEIFFLFESCTRSRIYDLKIESELCHLQQRVFANNNLIKCDIKGLKKVPLNVFENNPKLNISFSDDVELVEEE